MKFSDFKHDGRNYVISIDSDARFNTRVQDDLVYGALFEDLKKKIVRITRKAGVRLELPATYKQGGGRWGDHAGKVTLVPIIITGIHQRNRDILARVVGGKGEALRLSGQHEVLKRLTSDQEQEYHRLRKVKLDAEKAFEAFEKRYEYSIDDITDEVEKAEKAAGIEPDEKAAR